MSEFALAKRQEVGIATLVEMAKMLAESGMFPHPSGRPLNRGEVFSIVQYGNELGLTPVVSLMNIFPVNGRLCTSASIMLGLARQSGVRYEVKEQSDVKCSILFSRDGQAPYLSTFDQEEARQAGLLSKPTWKNYPKDMYRSRAVARGCRVMAPDKLSGLYLSDEINPDMPIDISGTEIMPSIPQENSGNAIPLSTEASPFDVAKLHSASSTISQAAAPQEAVATEKQVKLIHVMLNKAGIKHFESQFKDFLCDDMRMTDMTRSLKSLSKRDASDIISKFNTYLIDFYSEEKYHDELKAVFEGTKMEERVLILRQMVPLIDASKDLHITDTTFTADFNDQRANEWFSLLLSAIHGEEIRRRSVNEPLGGTEKVMEHMQQTGWDIKNVERFTSSRTAEKSFFE